MVDCFRCCQEHLSIGFGKNGIAETVLAPVEAGDFAVTDVAERRPGSVLTRQVNRQSLPCGIGVHKLGCRPIGCRKEPPSHQLIAFPRKVRNAQGTAEPFGQPLHQMRLLTGIHFYRMTYFRNKNPVCVHRFVGKAVNGINYQALGRR